MNLTEQKDLIKAQNKQNEITKAMMQNIVWQQKRKAIRGGTLATYDVSISYTKNTNHGLGSFNVSFIPERIAGLIEASFVKVAVLGDLLLFKASNEDEGWKILRSPNTSRVQVKISGNEHLMNWGIKNKGLYRIHYDANSDFYFINAAEKDVY